MSNSGELSQTRVHLFDIVRGFSVISMVLFHTCYDLVVLFNYDVSFFLACEDVWRASISWTFLAIAGAMSLYSRNNLRRALRYLLVALAIFIVTTIANVDTPISFGIIFCMGACTLISYILQKLGISPKGYILAALLFLLFIFILPLPLGYVGITAKIYLPRQLYAYPGFAWAGFPSPHFVSGDYYPLLPFLAMYLSGMSFFARAKTTAWFSALSTKRCAPLEYVGKHALSIYVLHQPLVLVLLYGLTYLHVLGF